MATPEQKTLKIPVPQQPLSRMKLTSIIRGRIAKPFRICMYGPEGVGKTTFAAMAPAPIFLGAEDGSAFLDVARFPAPDGGLTLADVYDAIRELSTETHEFQTLVIDTLDWLEPVIWRYICDRDKQDNIEAYGYGKGYQAALDEWRKLIAALERLQSSRGMNVILLAHSQLKAFRNPAGEDYDRYSLKLNEKAGGLIKEWSDDLLFAKHEEYAKRVDEKSKTNRRARGVSTGARLIYTERRASWDAKTRHSIPDEIPLSWADFETAAQANRTAPAEDLVAEITRKAQELGGDIETKSLELLKKSGNNQQFLITLNNRLNAKLTEKEQSNG